MKLSLPKVLVAVFALLAMALSASATIPFAHAHGYGLQTQQSYHEPYPIDTFGGLSYPVTSWYQWPASMDFNYSITADTDYTVGLHTVGYTDLTWGGGYDQVQVYIY